MERTKWLDGLRGVAAAIVAFDHYFMSDVWHPFVSYWSDPPENNRHLVQLQPIRILFSAHGMVTLFMVISGYAISISLLKARDTPQFLARVQSAVVRRAFRIYLPVLVTAGLAQVLYFLNLFHWEFDQGLVDDLPKPLSRPFAHLSWLLNYMADIINVVSFEYRGGINGQLWTMPVEFRGSNVVYLLIVGLGGWRAKTRLFALPLLACFFLWYGNWDIFGFIWGLWLAERANSASSASRETLSTGFEMAEYENGTSPLLSGPRTLSFCGGRKARSSKSRNCLSFSRIGSSMVFVVGYYLLCIGSDGHLAPEYKFLAIFNSPRWKDEWHIYHWCWKVTGSAMLVYGIGEFPCLQRPLNSRIVQYFGKISFSLYLLHETIYQLFRNPLRDIIYLALSGERYGTSGQAWGANPVAFHVCWWTTGIFLGCWVVVAAHFYTTYVDNRCVAFAKRVDRWLCS
ncbi:hypothetical protein N7532_003212 [Penicillium argentinense]|uniref:Acyltransferase 3 domain-containing protein n=1 Tax=Penicillium argentinense TaxID=1131581 RepID=A0A9W9FM09_9EURO|nr:uncharacterized protein N7532_003212 [Penicillium argentinense]KAJ5102683.1 hypothetical protein N7532_003212 [Penicillium argentinense]